MLFLLIASTLYLSPSMKAPVKDNHCGNDPLTEEIIIIEPETDTEDKTLNDPETTLIDPWYPEQKEQN